MKKASTTIRKKTTRKAPNQQIRNQEASAGTTGNYYTPLSSLTVTQIRDFILTCMWIDICVNTITDEVVKYPIHTDPEDTEIDAFLKYPSNADPLFLIRKKYLKDMLRYGNGVCSIEYKGGKPNRLVPIAGYLLRPTTDDPPKYKILSMKNGFYAEGGFIKNKDNTTDKVLSNKEIMHFAIDMNSDEALAISPLKKVYNWLQSDANISEKLAEFTSRGFLMPAFVSLEKTSDPDFKRFIEWINEQIAEGSKFFGITKKATVTDLPHWKADDIIRVSRWIGLCIANTFKVPPFMLNLIEDTGSLNAREQKQRFLENVIQPILSYECHLYTMILVRKGFVNTDTEITSEALGTRFNWDKARIAKLLTPESNILSSDEARKMFFNLPPMVEDTAQKKTKKELNEQFKKELIEELGDKFNSILKEANIGLSKKQEKLIDKMLNKEDK